MHTTFFDFQVDALMARMFTILYCCILDEYWLLGIAKRGAVQRQFYE
jgi:hypothetical protein